MAYNKFITSDGLVLLDLTTDTVTANKLPKGITAHDRSGTPIIGTAEVNSAIPTEVATEAEMTALLESGEVGGVYKYTGTTGTYENGALYVLENEGFNLTLSGGAGGSSINGGEQNTYIKINSKPTSSSDYDYDAKTLASSGSITVQASSYWYWDTNYGETYATATEVMLTEDTIASYSYYWNGGSNN